MRRYASPLLTFIRRMTGDLHQSEELFQDVFLAVWVGRHKYQYPRSFRAWLFGIAARKCRALQPQLEAIRGQSMRPVATWAWANAPQPKR